MLKKYAQLIVRQGVNLQKGQDLVISADVECAPLVKEIAKEAYERKTGARGLRAIIEETMRQVMFDVPSEHDIKECIITKGSVLDGEPPRVIREAPEIKTIELLEAK